MIFHGVSKGVSMGFPWGFNRMSVVFLWCFYGISLGLPWYFYGVSMTFLLDSYDMSFLWDYYGIYFLFKKQKKLWYFYGISVGFLWDVYGISMRFIWRFYGGSMIFKGCRWYFYGIPMVFQKDVYGMSIGSRWRLASSHACHPSASARSQQWSSRGIPAIPKNPKPGQPGFCSWLVSYPVLLGDAWRCPSVSNTSPLAWASWLGPRLWLLPGLPSCHLSLHNRMNHAGCSGGSSPPIPLPVRVGWLGGLAGLTWVAWLCLGKS